MSPTGFDFYGGNGFSVWAAWAVVVGAIAFPICVRLSFPYMGRTWCDFDKYLHIAVITKTFLKLGYKAIRDPS